MDKATFEAELTRRYGPRATSRAPRWSPEDVRDAIPHYLMGRAGHAVSHPVARALLDDSADLPRVVAMLDPQDGANITGGPQEQFVRAFNSSDFAVALAETTEMLVKTTYDLRSTVASLWRLLPVRDFRTTSFPVLEVSDGIGDPVPEGGELSMDDAITLTMASALEPAAVESRTVIMRFSRQLMAHDETTALLMQAEALAKSVRRAEAKALAALLEDATALSDSLAFFNTTTGNLIDTGSGAAPSVTTLNAATEVIWEQAECAPRYLVVPPTLATTAKVLASAVSVPGQANPLDVVVLPHLTSDLAWYLLPDPQESPAVGLMTLAQNGDVFSVSRAMRIPASDDIGVRVSADFRFARLARVALKNAGA